MPRRPRYARFSYKGNETKMKISEQPEYSNWLMMKNRCLNERDANYARWGAKGVKVCKRWLHGEAGVHPFLCFLADMGRKPSKRHSLDRYPNRRGNYKPGNVRWATAKQQSEEKIGVPRPDLSARNRLGKGKPRGWQKTKVI